MIYELTRQFKIELCRPFGACIVGDSLLRRGEPLRCFMSPLRGLHLITISSLSGLAFDNYIVPLGLAFDNYIVPFGACI